MTWSETYRGTVPPWECDVTEHFTIAYYFDRLVEAERNLAEMLGCASSCGPAPLSAATTCGSRANCAPAAAFTSRAPPSRSAMDGGLRLGHRFVDSANGETVTWIEESWELPPGSLPIERRERHGRPRFAVWEGPAVEQRPEPKSHGGLHPDGARPGQAERSRRRRPLRARRHRAPLHRRLHSGRRRRSAWTRSTWQPTAGACRPSSWRCG